MFAILIAGTVAALAGLALGALLRGAQRARAGIARWLRYIAAGLGTVVAGAFAAGVVGVLARSTSAAVSVPTLVVFALALIAATLLLWRARTGHLGVPGHWLGAAWWMLSALRAGSPVLAMLFSPVFIFGLLAAGMESAGAPAPEAPAQTTRASRGL